MRESVCMTVSVRKNVCDGCVCVRESEIASIREFVRILFALERDCESKRKGNLCVRETECVSMTVDERESS